MEMKKLHNKGVKDDEYSSILKSIGCCFYVSDKGGRGRDHDHKVVKAHDHHNRSPKYEPEAAIVAASKHFSTKVRFP